MLSKNKIKYIRSLELKKKRKEEQVFVAEGHKLVGDLLGTRRVVTCQSSKDAPRGIGRFCTTFL